MTRAGDPAILERFDHWWSTPLAYKDPDVDQNEWDAVVDADGKPIVLAVHATDMIGPQTVEWIKTHGATTVAVDQDGPAPLVLKITPAPASDSGTYSLFDPTFEWQIVVNDLGHDEFAWRLMGGADDFYAIKATWPLGTVRDGDMNRVKIN